MLCFLLLFATTDQLQTQDPDAGIFAQIKTYFDAVKNPATETFPTLPELSLDFFVGGTTEDWKGLTTGNPITPLTPKDLEEALLTRKTRYLEGQKDSASHLVRKKGDYYFKFLNLTNPDGTSDEHPENEFFAASFFHLLERVDREQTGPTKREYIAKTGLIRILQQNGSNLWAQVSPAISGITLKKKEEGAAMLTPMPPKDVLEKSYAIHFITSLILRVGDAKLENYVLSPDGIVSIDNEMIFRDQMRYDSSLRSYKYGVQSCFFLDKFTNLFEFQETFFPKIVESLLRDAFSQNILSSWRKQLLKYSVQFTSFSGKNLENLWDQRNGHCESCSLSVYLNRIFNLFHQAGSRFTFRDLLKSYDVQLAKYYKREHADSQTLAQIMFEEQQPSLVSQASKKLATFPFSDLTGMPKNEQGRLEWLKRQDQNNSEIQFNLGLVYLKGICGISKSSENDHNAYLLMKKSADKGFDKAQVCLGEMFNHGIGVSQDKEEGAKWHKNAANQGNCRSQFILAEYYWEKQEYSLAAEWYQKAALQGDDDAQFNLATMYEEGKGIKQSYIDAIKWYTSSAKKNNVKAQFKLGRIYDPDEEIYGTIQKEPRLSQYWYQRSADNQCAPAQTNIGLMYMKQSCSYKLAFKWFTKATEQKDRYAEFYVGLMHENAMGTKADHKIAAYWFERAAEQGHPESQNNLGLMYKEGRGVQKNDMLAIKWFTKAAEAGLPQGQYNTGKMFLDGGLGVQKNSIEATKWFLRSAKQRHNFALSELKKLADAGIIQAQFGLGTLYESGEICLDRKEQEALKYYRLAAIQDYVPAIAKLKQLGVPITEAASAMPAASQSNK